MKTSWLAGVLGASLLAGCAQEGAIGGPVHPAFGEKREVRVDTGVSEELLTGVVDEQGFVIHDGDINLGHVDQLDVSARSAASPVSTTAMRWKNAVLRWHIGEIDTTDPDHQKLLDKIEDAIAHIQQHTPVTFEKLASPSGDHLSVKVLDDPGVSGWSAIGRQGGQQLIALPLDMSVGRIEHEFLHALGFWHEQTRSDAATYVSYFPACVPSGEEKNFTVHADSINVGPYDFTSIMHYSSKTKCKEDSAGDCEKRADGSVCWPLEYKAGACPSTICSDKDMDPAGFTEYISGQRDGLSDLDINAVHAIYGKPNAGNEVGDFHAHRLAVGDFDDDGYQDLAISAVGESLEGSTTISNAGVVVVLKGTRAGLTPWKNYNAGTRPVQKDGTLGTALGTAVANGAFGNALAVGDFNGDGVDDLAVGTKKSEIYVLAGFANDHKDARLGLQPWKRLKPATITHETGAQTAFGMALAAGDFDEDGDDDLAVSTSIAGVAGGAVVIAKASSSGFAKWQTLSQSASNSPANTDAFGRALAAADLDGDGDADLAVGVPLKDIGDKANVGQVHVFRSDGTNLGAWTVLTPASMTGASNVASAVFGQALAAGRLDSGATADLAIGEPGNGAGGVHLYRVIDGALKPWKRLTQTGLGTNTSGDSFGSSLAVGRIDGDAFADLVVGAPGEGDMGAAYVFRGAASDVAPFKLVDYGTSPAGEGKALGSAVAIGDFENSMGATNVSERHASVVAGDSNSSSDRGVALRFDYDSAGGGKLVQEQLLKQNMVAPHYTP